MGWLDAIRRNHALEHATVAVLMARHGPTRLAGRASSDGFFILSDLDSDELGSCAGEALERLQRGEAFLAISPLCGTNIAVTGLLAAAAATGVLASGSRRDRFPNAFTAAMLGVLAAQPLGRIVQKHITTLPDLQGIEITGTRPVFGRLKKVHTRPAPS